MFVSMLGGPLGFVLAVLAGGVAGAGANWAADVLPGRIDPEGMRWRWRRPALLAATMVLFVAAWARLASTPVSMAIVWAYSAFLLAVLVIDYEHRLVLNVMLLPAAALALAASFLPGFPGPLGALLGAGAGFGLFLLFAVASRGHMGAGDVKLAAVIGLMLGFPAAMTALLAGVILGGLAAVLLILVRHSGRKSYMAYAPYMCMGALAVLLGILRR